MQPIPDSPNLWDSLVSFQAELLSAQGASTNPQERAALGEILADLEKARAEAQAVLAYHLAKLKARVKTSQPEIDSLLGQIEEKTKQVQARKKKDTHHPATPVPALTARPDERMPEGSLWKNLDDSIPTVPEPPAPPRPASLPAKAKAPPMPTPPPPEDKDASLWPFLDQLSPPDRDE